MKSANRMLFLATLFVFVIYCSSKGKQNEFLDGEQICRFGTKYIEWFYSSNLDSLINKILDKNYKLTELKKFRYKVKLQLGNRIELLNEQYGTEPWQYYYIQYHRFENVEQPVRTLFTFDKKGMILQYSVQTLQKEANTHFSEYKPKTKLSLPFRGEWFVAWGSRTINENQHAVSISQRFAYDFVIRKGSKTFDGDGTSNSDYYCYNQQVIAPGSGKVIEIINHVDDNEIGQMPKIHGNRVVIDHKNGEYSIIAHFRKGSIVVRKGDTVEPGQLLGLCGNSGHSSEPHIHYHLQNTPDIDNGEGLPVRFYSYLSNRKFKKVGEPQIGELIQNNVP